MEEYPIFQPSININGKNYIYSESRQVENQQQTIYNYDITGIFVDYYVRNPDSNNIHITVIGNLHGDDIFIPGNPNMKYLSVLITDHSKGLELFRVHYTYLGNNLWLQQPYPGTSPSNVDIYQEYSLYQQRQLQYHMELHRQWMLQQNRLSNPLPERPFTRQGNNTKGHHLFNTSLNPNATPFTRPSTDMSLIDQNISQEQKQPESGNRMRDPMGKWVTIPKPTNKPGGKLTKKKRKKNTRTKMKKRKNNRSRIINS